MKIILSIIFGMSCAFIINVGYAGTVPVKYVQISHSKIKPVKKDKSVHKTIVKPKPIIKPRPVKIKREPFFIMTSGFLLPNLRMFARKFNYHLVWKVIDVNTGEQMDYRWIGTHKVVGATSLDILQKILKPYPVVVNVWKTNRVVEVANVG
ncbi:MAG: hypothetical protein PVI75_01050 [Gammaproteobacteria bacterium]